MADERIPSREQALAAHAREKAKEHLNRAAYWFDLGKLEATNIDLQAAGAYFSVADRLEAEAG